MNKGSSSSFLPLKNSSLSVKNVTEVESSVVHLPRVWTTPNCGVKVYRFEPRLISLSSKYSPVGKVTSKPAPTMVSVWVALRYS